MGRVGIIVNPAAAHDVRRLTSLARTVDVHERVNTVARLLGGLAAREGTVVHYMPEPTRVVARAAQALAAVSREAAAALRLEPLELPEARDAAGTTAAAAAMARAGVACVVTVGGDGTNRAVAVGWPEAVLLPLPGGTNNALPLPIEPTAAGRAAALFAAAPRRMDGHLRRLGRLETAASGGPTTVALVDVAFIAGAWVGARAISEPDLLRQAVVARADPAATGLAGVAGALDGGASRAVHIRFGRPGRVLRVPLGPGVPVPVRVRGFEALAPGQPVVLGPGPGVLALDGEREIVLGPGEVARVRLSPGGPFLLDARGVLEAAVGETPAGSWGRPRKEVVPRGRAVRGRVPAARKE